jgi:multiple sugar transport system ATP-binding protein
MAAVSFSGVGKVYGDGTRALEQLDLAIADGEFVVLVGPSGCGKTTALRMLAGLEAVTEGEIAIGDRVVNELEPRSRDVAMVFQSYALYPQMTVAQNLGFGLRMRRAGKREISDKVASIAEVLGLTDLLHRRPAQLSGGQRQRVAMGRAIVRDPALFLMDEPLSNLDAQLRVEMRAEIARIQRELETTTVYVTHDQVEALTMGDRVCILSGGRLQQVGRPQDVYEHPANVFVARFLGSPCMNLFVADVERGEDRPVARIGTQSLQLRRTPPALERYLGGQVVLGLRPESIGRGEERLTGRVKLAEALGSETLVHLEVPGARVPDGVPDDVVARVDAAGAPDLGDVVELPVHTQAAYFFDPETGATIG